MPVLIEALRPVRVLLLAGQSCSRRVTHGCSRDRCAPRVNARRRIKVRVVQGVVVEPGPGRPPSSPNWEDVFGKLTQTWKKYVEDNEFEGAFQKSAEFGAFIDEWSRQTCAILTEAGVKLVR